MPPKEYRFPCVDCGGPDGIAFSNAPMMACCSRCRMQRRREGRNRVEVFCLKCSKAMYPEAREAAEFKLCKACRFEEKQAEWPVFNKPDPLPPGLREVIPEYDIEGYPWKLIDDSTDPYREDNKSYVMSQNITLHGRCFQKGTVILVNDQEALFGRRKVPAREIRGAIKLGWLEPTALAPTRFTRDDVI